MSAPATAVGTEDDACTGIAEHTPGVPQFAYVQALSDPATEALLTSAVSSPDADGR